MIALVLGALAFVAFVLYVIVPRRVAKSFGEPTPETAKIEARTRQKLEHIAVESDAAEAEVMNATDTELLRIARKRLWPDN